MVEPDARSGRPGMRIPVIGERRSGRHSVALLEARYSDRRPQGGFCVDCLVEVGRGQGIGPVMYCMEGNAMGMQAVGPVKERRARPIIGIAEMNCNFLADTALQRRPWNGATSDPGVELVDVPWVDLPIVVRCPAGGVAPKYQCLAA